jgi:hypothetical protein
MEMIFNSEEGIITSSEEIKIIISKDDITIHPLDYDSKEEIKKIPFTDLLYGYIYINNETNETKLIIPNINFDVDDIMLYKNNLVELKDLRLFICYFNFYKYCYYYHMHCHYLLTRAQNSLNSKELYLNMELYITKKYFKEISSKMLTYKALFSSFLSVMEKKAKNKELINILFSENNTKEKNNDSNNIINIENEKEEEGGAKLKILTDLKSLYIKIYDKLIEKKKNKNSGNIDLMLKKSNSSSIYISTEYHIEHIDKVKEYYLNLIKILNELKRSFYERIVSNKFDIYDIKNIERNKPINKLDICTRFYYIKYGKNQFNELKAKNQPYILENEKAKKENEILLSKLKQIIEKDNIQIYICFRCGNLLSKMNKKSKSTCNYDNNCFNISLFFCKICKIHFCSYCIHYPRDLKCIYSHSIKPINEDKNDNEKFMCDLCGKYNIKNKNNCYYCHKCIDAFMCKKCLEEAEKTKLVKYRCECGCHLFWRRGLFKKCQKCKQFCNCFWICFFCKKYYCLNCCKTFTNKCGLMHELKEICLDEMKHNNNMYVKDLLINKILLMRFNCDICQNKFFSRFFYCSRCNLIKCYKCNNSN